MDTAIVTDSTADIPYDICETLQINVMPNLIIIAGKNYEDNKDISREQFYEQLPEMKTFPTTATASSGSYQELYGQLLQKGFKQVISIHASSLLSGIFNAASIAAEAFDGKVHVVDSGQVTMGLGFQVVAAAEAARKGLSIEAILSKVADIGRRTRLIAMLDTFEYIRRSGRVSWARASIGNLLHIKVFVELKNGRILSLGEARTRTKGIERLLQYFQNLGPIEQLAILHSNAEEDAQNFLQRINLPLHPLLINVTTIIGAHVGPKGLGFVAVTK